MLNLCMLLQNVYMYTKPTCNPVDIYIFILKKKKIIICKEISLIYGDIVLNAPKIKVIMMNPNDDDDEP